jgi:pimeloyl-ACP methyl ester carboxylesterase
VIYLHGFASGPQSTKAEFFRTRLAAHGVSLAVPDLAPDFTHVTVSGMLAVVEPMLEDAPRVLLGSSLGGYLAALVATRRPGRVRALVLFAPAFGFARRWEDRVGAEAMARWRARGTAAVYHYGRRREEPLDVSLLDDARRYAEEPDPDVPALVFAGRRDDAVPLPAVAAFAARRPSARRLVVLDAGHELTEVLAPMWDATRTFLAALGALP